VRVARLELADQASVRAFAEAWDGPLDVLVNNGIGGRYYEDCHEAEIAERREGYAAAGVAPYALDAGNAERLWEESLGMLG
jgi:hypothetical protein